MRTTMLLAATAVVTLAGPLSARQTLKPGQSPFESVPLPPEKSVHNECYRPDVARNIANIKAAMAKPVKAGEAPEEVSEVQKKVAGCTFYKVTLVSKMTIEDTEIPGVTSTIEGEGSIVFGLAPDNAKAGYDFTSGVQDLTAPVYWKAGSASITKPKCEVTVVPLKFTLFAFWLGVSAPDSKVGVRIVPEGNELHPTDTKCKDDLGRWSPRVEGREAIFSPAWIRLRGEGAQKMALSGDQKKVSDFTNDLVAAGPKAGDKPKPNSAHQTPAVPTVSSPTGPLDMAKLQAMQDYMTKNPNATPAEMMKMMQKAVPMDLGAMAAQAQDNFMFTCAPVENVINRWQCDLGTTKTMSDRMGYGTLKKITDRTTITIQKVSAPPGSP